jgi:hypothetical protein
MFGGAVLRKIALKIMKWTMTGGTCIARRALHGMNLFDGTCRNLWAIGGLYTRR